MKVIGLETQKIYFEGESRNEAMRFINEEYPYLNYGESVKQNIHHNGIRILPEPMKVFK